jgi:GTP diphosphokinase / guanosine-3',5'-bis(diphosphate) 3'-diphosphatase
METLSIDEEKEKKEILKHYRQLVKLVAQRMKPGDDKRLRRAFEVAVDAHKHQRRKSGEPYILHPLAVAKIVASEIGLGTTSVMCALLHDTVEDTEITLADIKREFGDEITGIIDGLTKISKFSTQTESIQAENYRKILLTLSDDIRVILIKVADRLHNMRTLDTVPRKNQLKISSETIYLYAPLAHRLGLYSIKGELEDLAMKYTETDKYREIARLLNDTKKERNRFINEFVRPLKEELTKSGLQGDVFGRPKSISSIWMKMKKKGISFDDVYDKFAIRVILDSPKEKEKEDCWRAYSIITDQYKPSPNRLRDWISHPKANGYESLHTTVMGPKGKWVEVQIRSKRMDEIAEKGLAAHYKYKENKFKSGTAAEDAIESWLIQVREYLRNPEINPVDFINDFKLQLYTKEIYTFTPKGNLMILPVGATALDFAYSIHTDIGDSCIGAKVNNKLSPISYVLQSGDQVEIITSKKQKPNEDWLNIVTTSRAKTKIKHSLREEKKQVAEVGREMLERKLKQMKLSLNNENIQTLVNYFKVPSSLDLFYNIGKDLIDLQKLKELHISGSYLEIPKAKKEAAPDTETDHYTRSAPVDKNAELIIFGESSNQFPYEFAKCCAPIPGDDVVGFISINGIIKIHRTNCNNVINLMSKYGYRIVKTKWTGSKAPAFLTGISINGIDDLGVINKITNIISADMKVNMQSMALESNNGIFEGTFKVFVKDQHQLNLLLDKLGRLEGILSVNRMEV